MRNRWAIVALVTVVLMGLGLGEIARGGAAGPTAAALPAVRAPSSSSDDGDHDLIADRAPASEGSLSSPLEAHPYVAPPVEPQEVLDSMTREEIQGEVSQIADDLQRRDAVKRLNEGRVTEDERAELGAMMFHVSMLKAEIGKRDLEDLKQKVAEYEQTHAARVAAYVHKSR